MKKIILATAVLSLMSARLHAIAVTPSLQYFTLNPGESIQGEVVVSNSEDEQLTVFPTTKNWFLLHANKNLKVQDWLTIEQDSFVLKPGTSKKLHFTAKAPKKSEGELVGMLSFHTKSPTRTSADFIMSVAVYVAVKGTEKLAGDIAAMTVTPSSTSVQAGILLRNKGNVHLRPQGMLQIYDGTNELVLNVELKKGQPTYPGNERTYFGVVNDYKMVPGKYTASIELTDMDRGVLIDRRRQTFTVSEDRKVRF